MNLSYLPRFGGLANMLGSVLLAASLTATMSINPLTPRIYAFVHLVGVAAGVLLITGLLGLKLATGIYTGRLGLTAFLVMLLGLVLLITGNFFYAFFHSLLGLVSPSDPLPQVPLGLARYLMCAGSALTALCAVKTSSENRWPAYLLVLGSLVYLVGWALFGDSFYRQRNLSRHLKAGLIVFLYCVSWFWIGCNLLLQKFEAVRVEYKGRF